MYFIGDIHGKFQEYSTLLTNMDASIQLGDFGIFDQDDIVTLNHLNIPPQHRFIKGNHDSPALCRTRSNYLGDIGFDKNTGIFYISGGFSIDKENRTIGVDWWEDEELPYAILLENIEYFKQCKPEIVISHSCPSVVKPKFLRDPYKMSNSRTEAALSEMFEVHQPAYWIFAHYHTRQQFKVKKTNFVALQALWLGPRYGFPDPKSVIFEIKI